MIQRNAVQPFAAAALVRVMSAAACGLCATLVACSDESLNMGEGVPVVETPVLPSSSRCRESPVLEGEVVVRNQEQVDALEGCEGIDGDLYIGAFADAQLRALHALTAVSGRFTIGGTPDEQFGVTQPPGLVEPWSEQEKQEFLEGGWLSSLEGLEALESAGRLTLYGLASEDLAPLGNLTTLTDGLLEIWAAPNLKNFNGLQKLSAFSWLSINAALQLESFDGLTLPSEMEGIDLNDVDLRQLKPLAVTYLGSLHLEDTQQHDLAPFANLIGANAIQIVACQQLESLAGLENLENLSSLDLDYNGYLLDVPDFDKLYRLDALRITGSPSLARLPAFPIMQIRPNYVLNPQDFTLSRPDVIELDTLGVTAFSLPGSWLSASVVKITNNAALTRVDFTGQSYIDYLWIQNNPLLLNVSTGALDKVNVLEVVDNPRLSLGAFASVRHLDMTASGNADAP